MKPVAGVTAIVLAGGRSSRFGSPKLAVAIEGRTLLEHAIDAVAHVADAVIVAGVPATDTFDAAATIFSLPDQEAFAGPLAGLAGALEQTQTASAIVVGGDMPALVPEVLRAMLERLAAEHDIDAVLLAEPSAEGQRQVLPLAIDVASGTSAAADALAAGDRSLVRMLERLRVDEIASAEWLALDPVGRTLLDIDRPSDVDRIRHELR
jgi:molybdopterin-guanine dinucleotide biosynthesis protein A